MRLAKNILHMEERRNEYKVLVGKSQKQENLGDVGIDRIILKILLEK